MTSSLITIATRESPLALWQAEWARSCLQSLYPNLTVQLLGLTTTADQLLSVPLTAVGGKGLFVKELEEALREKRADIAVHSMKDVPMDLPDGLTLSAICRRADVHDAFISNHFHSLQDMPSGATIGTSSLRRQGQLKAIRPDLQWVTLRGNINTRLKRLDQGHFDAIILAAAGLIRLDLQERIQRVLSIEESLPACGQGALGIECRAEDSRIQQLIAPLNHLSTQYCVMAERALCKRLGGGCSVPVAAFAEQMDELIILRGRVAEPDGRSILQATHSLPWQQAEALGKHVAESLLKQGAETILSALGVHNGKS